MPDITMCATEGCPLAGGCYRSPESGITISEMQSFDNFLFHEGEDGVECENYWPIEGE